MINITCNDKVDAKLQGLKTSQMESSANGQIARCRASVRLK